VKEPASAPPVETAADKAVTESAQVAAVVPEHEPVIQATQSPEKGSTQAPVQPQIEPAGILAGAEEAAPGPTQQPTHQVNDVAAQPQSRHPKRSKGKLRRMPKYRQKLKAAIKDAWYRLGRKASYVDISRDVDEQYRGIGENEYPWPAPGGQRGLEARLNGPDESKVKTYLSKIKRQMIDAKQF
jgi:hypothetical protein